MARKPYTRNAFDMTGTQEDLPLFSGQAPIAQAATFKPAPVASQPAMFDLRPTFGSGEPTYTTEETNQ